MNNHQPHAQAGGDPRLTAYALGELQGAENAADRAEIEALLAQDAEARKTVEELRELAGVLTQELAAEAAQAAPAAGLTEGQRRSIEQALTRADKVVPVAPLRPAGTNGATNGAAHAAHAAPRGGLRWLRFVPALAAAALIAAFAWHQWSEEQAAPGLGRSPHDNVARDARPSPGEDFRSGSLQSLGYLDTSKTDGAAAARSARKDVGLIAAVPVEGLEAQLPGRDTARDLSETESGRSEEFEARDAALNEVQESSSGLSRGPDGSMHFENAPAAGAVAAADETTQGAAEQSHTGYQSTRQADGATGGTAIGLSSPGFAGKSTRGLATGAEAEAEVLSREAIDELKALGYSGGSSSGSAPAAAAPALPASASKAKDALAALGYVADATAAEDDDGANPLGKRGRDHDQPYRYFRSAPGGEGYQPIVESGFQSPLVAPRSTFSVDVDTASYANVRRFLNDGQLPPADAVRLEELINYFHYDYPQPDGEHPFSVTADVTSCPWAAGHRLVRLGLQGRTVPQAERAPSNLVFLVDVSGSMNSPDKLPLVQASLRMLVGKLDARDRIALVTYAGAAGLVLDSTSCAERQPILDALDRLTAGGSTAGGAGIALAYQVAAAHFLEGGTNRVILATDGDFNVGITSRDELQGLIERSAKGGVFLTVLGYGTGNLQDGTAELLADKGNGNYAYIDSLGEAQKVLVQQMGGTLITIAKDVKLQVEFNPGRVAAYRLLGYENRALATRDFNDDRKDAGEIGSGHSVTALYEVIPVGAADAVVVDALRYQKEAAPPTAPPVLNDSPELLYVALRYKQPTADTSTLLGQPVVDGGGQVGADLSFIAAVAEFGMLLRSSGNSGTATWDSVRALAEAGRGADKDGYRAEFVRLVDMAKSLQESHGQVHPLGGGQPKNRR